MIQPLTPVKTMRCLRGLLFAGATFALTSGAAAQSSVSVDLPPGLLQKTSAVVMAPLATSTAGVNLNTERRQSRVRLLSAADHDLYLRAFAAAEHNDWSAARSLAAQARDPSGRRIIEWRYLMDKNSGASFNEIAAFLRDNPEWPDRDVLSARAEAAIDPNTPPQTVFAFFQGRDPVSDIGKVRLGEAYLATGNPVKGTAIIRDAWINGEFDLNQESDVVWRHGNLFTPDVERERLKRLLFKNELAAAEREMARAPSDAREVAETDIALEKNPTQGLRLLNGLLPALQNDPAILFDRAKLLRQQNQVTAIPPLLSHTREMAQIAPRQVWSEINSAARLAIQDRYFSTAHTLLGYSGLSSGDEYAEAEFLAGWLDLRFLRNPREAHTHFINLGRNAERPVSKSRAFYWAGRAGEAAGDYTQARQDYGDAARYPQTFYGQLSLAKLQPAPTLRLYDTAAQVTPAETAQYQSLELTRAMHVLADLGLVAYLRVFATYDAQAHPEPTHLRLLASDLAGMGFTDVAIRVAKNGAYKGIHFLEYSHPVIGLPTYSGPGYAPDQAFVLAVIRQETEFDPAAVSPAGARGLMQLMPDSAKRNASRAGLAYAPNQLLSNPTYNMRLGMVELAEDLQNFGGSYLLTAAAYNAGRTNVYRWISAYGDPRSPVVDPLDWIEEIPFAETRNYVMRVFDNMEVYRNRLSGRDEPLRILADLYRPRTPDVRPLPAPPPPTLRSDNGAPESVAGR